MSLSTVQVAMRVSTIANCIQKWTHKLFKYFSFGANICTDALPSCVKSLLMPPTQLQHLRNYHTAA